MGYSLTAGNYGFMAIVDAHRDLAELEEQEKLYTATLVDLEITLKRLESDSLYLEKLAREKYHLGRPGETVIEF
jgi:cell division protein FtsB